MGRISGIDMNANTNPLQMLAQLTGAMNVNPLKPVARQQEKPLDIHQYFEDNRLKEPISDEDMITVSKKTETGYRAFFVTFGDLKKAILKDVKYT